MSSILLCSTPVRGHIAPLLAVTRALTAHGHDVRFLTGGRYRQAVERAGARFLPLPKGADFDDRTIDETFPGRVGLTGPAAVRYDMMEIFLRPVPQQAAAIDAALNAEHTDVVMAESLFAGIMPLLLRPRHARPAVLNLGIVPLGLISRDTAPAGLGIPPMAGAIGRLRNALLNRFATRVVLGSVQKEAQRLVKSVAGNEFPEFFLNWMARSDGVVQFTVQEFEYPRSDLTTPVHFVGPVSQSASTDIPLPSWWHDLDGSRPVIHVTQGTVANNDFSELVLPTIRGLAQRDVVVVVSTGGRAVSALGTDLPANVRVASLLPYDALLAKTSVMITNGGYGGVHFALQHGVPLVVAGMTEDKPDVTARVAWSGTGVNLRTNRPAPAAIARAVDRVLADPSYRAAAQRIGERIRTADGVDGILPLVEQHSQLTRS
jgi:MGT family glycosyltransferase